MPHLLQSPPGKVNMYKSMKISNCSLSYLFCACFFLSTAQMWQVGVVSALLLALSCEKDVHQDLAVSEIQYIVA